MLLKFQMELKKVVLIGRWSVLEVLEVVVNSGLTLPIKMYPTPYDSISKLFVRPSSKDEKKRYFRQKIALVSCKMKGKKHCSSNFRKKCTQMKFYSHLKI